MRMCLRRIRQNRLRLEFLEDRRLLSAVPAIAPPPVQPAVYDYAPALTGPTALSVTQGGTIALSGANLITDADLDAGTTVETVALSATGGTLSIASDYGRLIAGANFSSQLTISGTLPQLNETLATLSYTAPVAGTAFTLTAVANDGVLSSVPLTTAIAILPDQPPSLTGPPAIEVTQGATLPLNAGNLIRLADTVSGTRTDALTLTVSGGTLSFNVNYGTLIAGANNSDSLSVTGTLSELNGLLSSISYQAPVGGSQFTLTAVASDGVLSGNALYVPIVILPDQAPVLTGPASLSVTQGMTVPLSGANLISDAHIGTGTNPETVALAVSGGTLSYNSNYGKLIAGANDSSQLTFSGTLSQLNETLATLSYHAPIAFAQYSLTVIANDGVLNSAPLTTVISLLPDSAPVLTGPSRLTVVQGLATPLNGPNLIALASQNAATNVETLSVSATSGTVKVGSVYGTLIGGANNSASLTLSGTLTQLNESLASLSYQAPLAGAACTLTVVANDGVLNSVPLSTLITIVPDTGPALTGANSVSITQGATLALNGPNLITLSDPDIGTNIGTVSLSVGAGTLSYATGYAALIAGSNGSNQLTLSGTLAQLNDTLAKLSYKAPSTGSVSTLTAVANDGVLSSQPLETYISIGADQAPTLTGPASVTISNGEMLPLIGASAISVAHSGGTPTVETVTLSVTGGTLSYTSNYGTLAAGANDSSFVTFSGTLTQLNNTLATLSYKAPPSGTGFTLTVVANDGVLSSAPLTIPIDIPDPWQNPANPLEVINNEIVSPADALVIIDYLNLHPGNTVLPPISQPPQYFLDVDGSGIVTPADALEIIDYLNEHPVTPQVAAANVAGVAPAGAETVGLAGSSLAAGIGIGLASPLNAPSVRTAAAAGTASNAALMVRQEPSAAIAAGPAASVPPDSAVVDAALAELALATEPAGDESE